MSSRYKEFYKNRIFGSSDDETTPPRSQSKNISSSSSSNQAVEYPFSHSTALASTRLNLQHHLWHASTGYLLHPCILLPNTYAMNDAEPFRIADIACGTAMWSLSLLPTIPTPLQARTRIDAHDLHLSQILPKAWLPENLSVCETDIFAPVNAELRGKYDVVHARLLLCTFSCGDPMPLLKNLLAMLKPGGFLQWQEYNPLNERLLVTPSSASAPKLEALKEAFSGEIGRHKWIESTEGRFQEVGAELVVCEKGWTKPEFRGLKQEVTFLAVREWCAKLREQGKEHVAGRFEGLVEGAERECWGLGRGSVIDTEMVTWVVRKK